MAKPTTPKLTPITSSALSGHHYDPQTRQMTVQFRSGATWQYDDVPAEKFDAFTGAASPGSYFGSKIRDHFKGRKL